MFNAYLSVTTTRCIAQWASLALLRRYYNPWAVDGAVYPAGDYLRNTVKRKLQSPEISRHAGESARAIIH